jgi:glycosyltransferase involved in cell wall biosynthesis
MHAFRAAFPHGQTRAVLAIKLLVNEFSPTATDQREYFSSDSTFGDDIILIIEAISDLEMTELLSCCDAFVSLHRSEGFGLGAAEAMSLAKPVIVTNWSGPVDYLSAENSFRVPYRLVTIADPGSKYYKPGLEWAEPDLDVATGYMRALVDDPALGEVVGRQAALDIAGQLSIPVVGAAIAARLKQLHTRG